MIFLDGHYSHTNNISLLEAVEEFENETGKKVRLVCIPPGLTDILQPLDVAVFSGVKKRWNEYLRDFSTQPGENVRRSSWR